MSYKVKVRKKIVKEPETTTKSYYECPECGYRDDIGGLCPNCEYIGECAEMEWIRED